MRVAEFSSAFLIKNSDVKNQEREDSGPKIPPPGFTEQERHLQQSALRIFFGDKLPEADLQIIAEKVLSGDTPEPPPLENFLEH